MDSIISILKSIAPLLGIGVAAYIGYWIKLIIDKNRNVKKVEGCIWVQIIPNAGTEKNFMPHIEDEHGTQFVRIPDTQGKVTNNSPRYVLGSPGAYPAIWPPNKPRFVQLTVRKITYYEGDTEPLSNVTNMPIVSAQALTNMIQGVSANAEEIMTKLKEESEGKLTKKSSPLMWLYVIVGITGVIAIINLVFSVMSSGNIDNLITLIKQALGLK